MEIATPSPSSPTATSTIDVSITEGAQGTQQTNNTTGNFPQPHMHTGYSTRMFSNLAVSSCTCRHLLKPSCF